MRGRLHREPADQVRLLGGQRPDQHAGDAQLERLGDVRLAAHPAADLDGEPGLADEPADQVGVRGRPVAVPRGGQVDHVEQRRPLLRVRLGQLQRVDVVGGDRVVAALTEADDPPVEQIDGRNGDGGAFYHAKMVAQWPSSGTHRMSTSSRTPSWPAARATRRPASCATSAASTSW